MPAAKVAKIVVLVLLLIAAGFFFGKACQGINQQYQLLLSLDTDFLHSLLTLLLAIAVVAITGGLVTALVRPLWIPIVAFALSSLAAFIAWELSPASGLSALIYFAFSALYSRGVAEALNNQVKFSVEPISGSQSVLLAGLAIAASVSLYFGYAAEIEERGFEFPPAVRDMITEISTAPMRAQIEAREDLTSEGRDAMAAQMSEGFEQWMLSMDEMIQPYERFVPVMVAFMLFQVLAVANTLFSWVPIAVLAILFRILTSVGLATKTTEMMEAVRLSID
jgi:uncharacterized membrane protein